MVEHCGLSVTSLLRSFHFLTVCGRAESSQNIVHNLDQPWPGFTRQAKASHHNEITIYHYRHGQSLFEASVGRAESFRKGLVSELEQELNFLRTAWPQELPAGVIHADLFPDNVFFHNGDVSGIIDFYFACNDFFAYEIAICLNAWCFENDLSFNVTKAKRLLSSYRKVREFTDAELKALPILARGSAMRFLLTRLYDWLHTPENALVTRKDPLEYLEKLRFHQGITGPSAYGLD